MKLKNRMKRHIAAAALVMSAIAFAASPCRAQSAEGASAAEKYFTDVILVNQENKDMQFYSDLIKGKVVIINTFFTTCKSVCPPMTHSLTKVQEHLGERLGKEVHIISISVDPDTDTPPRLKDFAEKYKARPGWYFITGKKENLEMALKKIGQFAKTPDDHTTVMIIGNEKTGLWKKAFGLASPPALIEVVDSVLQDK
jgi:protein SCO1/2